MKKLFFFLFLISYFLFLTSYAHAATPTASDKIQEIKDQLITNIASRVAELKLVEKRGIVGKVTEVSNTQITIVDLQNNNRFIDVDELTKFSSPNSSGSFGISDITKDANLGILGLYNKDSRRILARFVNVISISKVFQGTVLSINKDDFSFDIAPGNNKKLTIDVENITKTLSYTPEKGVVRSGFSKIKENYTVIVAGFMDAKNSNRFTATRVIVFPHEK